VRGGRFWRRARSGERTPLRAVSVRPHHGRERDEPRRCPGAGDARAGGSPDVGHVVAPARRARRRGPDRPGCRRHGDDSAARRRGCRRGDRSVSALRAAARAEPRALARGAARRGRAAGGVAPVRQCPDHGPSSALRLRCAVRSGAAPWLSLGSLRRALHAAARAGPDVGQPHAPRPLPVRVAVAGAGADPRRPGRPATSHALGRVAPRLDRRRGRRVRPVLGGGQLLRGAAVSLCRRPGVRHLRGPGAGAGGGVAPCGTAEAHGAARRPAVPVLRLAHAHRRLERADVGVLLSRATNQVEDRHLGTDGSRTPESRPGVRTRAVARPSGGAAPRLRTGAERSRSAPVHGRRLPDPNGARCRGYASARRHSGPARAPARRHLFDSVGAPGRHHGHRPLLGPTSLRSRMDLTSMETWSVTTPLTLEDAARRAGLAAALVALAGGALTLNHLLPGVFYDDGLYTGIAYALSHGLGYAHPHLPGHPAAVHFPPLYPLVLTPFVGLL